MNRSYILPTMGAGVALLLAVGSFASTADAAHGSTPGAVHHGVVHHTTPTKAHGNCYSNMRNDSGTGIVSQNFTDAGYDIYDSTGAVPFTVKRPCVVSSVVTVGVYFNGAGPADSETVTFYTDDGGVPGSVIDSQNVVGTDSGGSFTIPLNPVTIPAGPAWVGVTATMGFAAGGEWGWELSTNARGHGDSLWENPADGLGTGCTTWGDVTSCLGYSGSFMVQLVKQYQQ